MDLICDMNALISNEKGDLMQDIQFRWSLLYDYCIYRVKIYYLLY